MIAMHYIISQIYANVLYVFVMRHRLQQKNVMTSEKKAKASKQEMENKLLSSLAKEIPDPLEHIAKSMGVSSKKLDTTFRIYVSELLNDTKCFAPSEKSHKSRHFVHNWSIIFAMRNQYLSKK